MSVPITAAPWSETEITLIAEHRTADDYCAINLYADFAGPGGALLRRPAFWDGDGVWRIRAALPTPGAWTWRTVASVPDDAGLHDRTGTLDCSTDAARPPNAVTASPGTGLLRMSPGHRSVVWTDGSPMFLVGDTAWALPWRGVPEAVQIYAADRRQKGFNCALLMCVQPDRDAVGPRDRQMPGGFEVGFEDLPSGHINQLNPSYFQSLDTLIAILLSCGIVPIYQPVFQGYGWKGLGTLGGTVDPREYARFCRYLVARYGARPAIWLVSADGDGHAPCVEAGGREIEAWDAYRQPTGIHYNPFDSTHQNRAYQDAPWLDFQWCQTGHDGTDGNKVSAMADRLPPKGVANGEPTYEGIADPARASGWWQGETAWSNLTWGAAMGVFYGVAALWQWKCADDEPGWPPWATDPYSWRTALDLPGSRDVGRVGQALHGYDLTDAERHPELAGGRPCIARPERFYCVYLPEGGTATLSGLTKSLPCCWLDPKTGHSFSCGRTAGSAFTATTPTPAPWVLLAGERHAHALPD